VQAALEKWGLSPHDLEFDVPEALLSTGHGGQPDVLQRLHDLGVRIAIDDFGAEYTAIGRLKTYEIKRLKIAPQFVKAMTSDPADAGAVRLMIHLASQLGIEILAKSVETEEQQAFLRTTSNCANAQGYYYSKPLPAGEVTDFFRNKRPESRVAPTAPPAPGAPLSSLHLSE
jgi:EAL domain-containing protein (putative c-di-GMP-specific phosphodiesterase class I)